MEQKN